MADYSSMSDAELMSLVKPSATAPDYSKMSDAELMQTLQPKPPVGATEDFIKSIPYGAASNLTSQYPFAAESPSPPPELPQASPETIFPNIYKPQGRAGQFGAALGAGVGNPMSYIGPGSAALKVGGAVLSSLGGEAGRQAAEGTPLEVPAQIVGSLGGGIATAKTLGPTAPKAAIPTQEELFSAGRSGKEAAKATGLELNARGFGNDFAGKSTRTLVEKDFTSGPDGTAPQTFRVLDKLQNPPDGAVITPSNLSAIKQKLQTIAEEVKPTEGGSFTPTKDAAAASIALDHLKDYAENIPKDHVLAGSAEDYVRAIKQSNADFAAGYRVRDFNARLTKAERIAGRQVAGSLENQIRGKIGSAVDNPTQSRGLTPQERAQADLVAEGKPLTNILWQAGRGGAGVVPLAIHGTALAASGGALALPQAALAAALYGARKTSQAITQRRGNKLVEMLAKRSPEYQRRVAALPAADNTANKAALIRALLAH